MKLILGSASPRRRELLRQIGLDFEIRTADIDETKYQTADPVATVCATCQAKALAVAKTLPLWEKCPEGAEEGPAADPAALVVSSDTIVVLDGQIMGKPHSPAQAEAMLTALSGREHAVYTAFTLLPVTGEGPGAPETEFVETKVRFRPLTRGEILAYIATGEPMDKAGAYGIQGMGACFVEGIEGDYFTVMGLPLCRLSQRLKDYGIDVLKG